MENCNRTILPYPTIIASLERIEMEGIDLVDTGEFIYLYVLKMVDLDLIS